MGAPLTIALALVVVWAFRRSTKRLRAAEPQYDENTAGPRQDDTIADNLIEERTL